VVSLGWIGQSAEALLEATVWLASRHRSTTSICNIIWWRRWFIWSMRFFDALWRTTAEPRETRASNSRWPSQN